MRNLKKDIIDNLLYGADMLILRIRLGLSTKKRVFNIAEKIITSLKRKPFIDIRDENDLKKIKRRYSKVKLLNKYQTRYIQSFYKKEDFQNYMRARANGDITEPLIAKKPKLESKVSGYLRKMEPTTKLNVRLKRQIERFNEQRTPITVLNPRYINTNINTLSEQPTGNNQQNRNCRTQTIEQRLSLFRRA